MTVQPFWHNLPHVPSVGSDWSLFIDFHSHLSGKTILKGCSAPGSFLDIKHFQFSAVSIHLFASWPSERWKLDSAFIFSLFHFLAEGERLLSPAWPRTPAEGPVRRSSSLQDGLFVCNCCSISGSEADHLLMPTTSCRLVLAFSSPLRIPCSGHVVFSPALTQSGSLSLGSFHNLSPSLSIPLASPRELKSKAFPK